MTVSELIVQLQNLPPETRVYVAREIWYCDATDTCIECKTPAIKYDASDESVVLEPK
jgi:hypothetical protein